MGSTKIGKIKCLWKIPIIQYLGQIMTSQLEMVEETGAPEQNQN